MARMKRQRSYSENSTLDVLKMASDTTTAKPLNFTSNNYQANDASWRKSSVLPRRRYLSVGTITKFSNICIFYC